ncbi:MAG: rane protein [Acidobacteria bacterium]|jgi:membrane associated rhomboid family serine protease|nr:rane protein [Acidobacteriota bacterium]
MFPLRDDNPKSTTPIVTLGIIIINVIVFFYQLSLGARGDRVFIYEYGAIPAVITGGEALPQQLQAIPAQITIFTSMFLHGGWAHLIGNMWYLWIFGDNVEEAMGHFRYLIFYLITGLLASLSHIISNTGSVLPSIGASGAISGVLGAYLLLYPRARVLTLIFLGFFIRLIYIPAGFVLGFWFLLQLLGGSMAGGQDAGGVAFWAHVGGFVSGLILISLFRKRRPRVFVE